MSYMSVQPRIRINILWGKKVLQATMDSDDKGSKDYFEEFCFMTMEEEREADFDRGFEELYVASICMAKKSKKLIEQPETINKGKEVLEEKLKCKEWELKHANAREEELQKQLASKLIGNWGHNHNGKYNKLLQFGKAFQFHLDNISLKMLALQMGSLHQGEGKGAHECFKEGEGG